MIKKITKNKLLLSFLLSLLLGALIVVPNIIAGHGIYYLIDDLNLQQIPFNMINNYSIKNGNIFFSWFNDFGSSFIPTYSFYNLFSPFNMIGYLFSFSLYPYLLGPLFILKYGISGLTSYLFLKRYVKNKNYAVLGSLLYTFSGFQLINILFYHFHDVVAFFPLLLYTLDNLVYDNKKGRFLLVVTLSCLTNWFFFIEEVIFLVIYYVVKVITKEYKFTFKSLFTIILEGFLGTFICMFVLLPTVIFTSSNARLSSNWTMVSAFINSKINFLELVRTYIMSSQAMSMGRRAMLRASNYSSLDLYLPLVGAIFAISYIFHNWKKSTSILLILSGIIMFIPILNSSFVLFNTTTYYRWFFMPILIMSLATIKCIEEKQSIKLSTSLITIGLVLFTFLFIIKSDKLVNVVPYTIVIIVISFFNIIITNVIYRNTNKLKLFFIFVSLYVVFYGNFMASQYKYSDVFNNNNYREYLEYDDRFSELSDGRSNSSVSCFANMGNTKRINNIRSFNSNISGTVFEFLNSVGINRSVSTIIGIEDKKLNDFLGVKYIISCDGDMPSEYDYVYYKDIGSYKIFKNLEYIEFGSSFKNYISKVDYDLLSNEDKINTLNESVVLDSDQIKKYSYLYPNDVVYQKNEFKFLDNGFSSNIISSGETLAIYQIPYDSGWIATNNGKKIDIEKVDNGFIAVKINKGENNIRFKYVTPGLKIGIIISIVSLILSVSYIMYNKCKEK